MLKILQVMLMAAFSISAIAATGTTIINAKLENKVYTEDQQNIIVPRDQSEFTIKLKSNPTTGYSWFLREYDSNILSPINHTFQAPGTKLIGAPGYELWTFKVKPSGFVVPQQTTIRLIYARPWQGADNATQLVFRVTTQIK